MGRFRDTTHAFIGTVLEVTANTARFRVEYVLRGAVTGSELRVSDHAAPEIAVAFQAGARYFVAAAQLPDGSLITSACKGTREVTGDADVDSLLALSGDPPLRESAPVDFTPVLVILAIVVSLGAGWYIVLLRERSRRDARR